MIKAMLDRWAAHRAIKWLHANNDGTEKTKWELGAEALLWDMAGAELVAERCAQAAQEID